MEKFVGYFKELNSYFRLSKAELNKVIFPVKTQVRNAFITVLIVVGVISLFLALVDAVMTFSLSKLV